ncbi:hypothetical protein ACP70R_032385 [Stipagrostis hirtigluma subsp. patula]
MCPLDIEAGDNTAEAIADIAEASHDVMKLPYVLVAGGVGEGAAALNLTLFKPPAGLFLKAGFLLYFYYAILVAIVLFGIAEAWTGLWVSHDPRRRRAVGVVVLWASVLPLLLLAGIGGFALLE